MNRIAALENSILIVLNTEEEYQRVIERLNYHDVAYTSFVEKFMIICSSDPWKCFYIISNMDIANSFKIL